MANKIELIVRHYVNKILSETLDNFEDVIEEKIREKFAMHQVLQEMQTRKPKKSSQKSLHEVMQEDSVNQSSNKPRFSLEKLGLSDDVWKDVYSDTMNSSNPILREERTPGNIPTNNPEKPEHVSEVDLEKLGLMRDYSKHVDAFDSIDKKKKGDTDLEQKRKEILSRTIKQ